MKRLTALFLLTPGLALAHGAHGPVPPASHEAVHTAPILGVALIVLAFAAIWCKERRS